MKKTNLTVILTVSLVSLLASCAHPLMKDPRLYNKGNKPGNNTQIPTEEPDIEKPQGFTPFDLLNEWYNNPDTNGDATNTNVGFSNTEFDKMSISGWFSKQNVPTYTMKQQDVWGSCKDPVRNEYVHSGAPNTEGQGFTINGVTYFQYRGKNPCYAGDGGYNTIYQKTANGNPLLERFYFYRFTGKGGGIQWLDNFLIAIDTYSKLIFAFAEPVKFSSMGAPTAWAPTDKDKFEGVVYPFYMYDPVGYVLKNNDGSYSVELYKWFTDRLAAGNYKGNINSAYADKIATKTPEGAGRSPFLSEVAPAKVPFLEKVKGRTFAARENYNDLNANWQKDGQGYGENLIKFVFNEDGKSLQILTVDLTNNIISTITANTKATLLDENDVSYKYDDGTDEIILHVHENEDNKQDVGFITLKDHARRYINNFKDKGPAFKFRVKGKTFSARQNNGYTGNDGHGYGMLLYKYTFDETGTKVTKETIRWGKEAKTVGTYEISENTPMTCIANGENLTINSGSDVLLSDNGSKFFSNFSDKGPSFENRVQTNPSYNGDANYKFINGYKKLNVDGIDYTFERFEPEYNKAVYWKQDNVGTYYFYGIELTNNDKTIKMTKWSGKDLIRWNTLGWKANRNEEQIGPEIYSKLKNKTFSNRDEGGYGSNLYSYTFSSDGKSVTYSKTPWEGTAETLKGTYIQDNDYSIGGENITIEYDETEDVIKINNKVFYNYYDDKGPAFTTKVKGKTYGFRELAGYTGNDGNGYGLNLYIYKFNEDGTKVEYTVTNWATSETSNPINYNITMGEDKSKGIIANNITLFVTPVGKLTSTQNGQIDTYIQDFKDELGPSFLNRVKNNKFYDNKGKLLYEFTNNGRTLKVDGHTYTYDESVQGHNGRNRAGYNNQRGLFNSWYFIGVEINKPNIISKTPEILASKRVKWGSLGKQATLKK